MSTALQLVPGLSMLFEMTSTVGAALWAAELERLGEKANEPERKEVLPPREVDKHPEEEEATLSEVASGKRKEL